MPQPYYFALRRVARWIESETGLTVLAADQPATSEPGRGVSRPALPYVGLSDLPGSFDGGKPAVWPRIEVPIAWSLDFSALGAADPKVVRIEGFDVEAAAGTSGAAARDAWLAAFEDSRIGVDGWVTAADGGGALATLATGAGWAAPTVQALQGPTLTVTAQEDHREIRTPMLLSWRVQVYGRTRAQATGFLATLREAAYTDPPPWLRRLTAPSSATVQSGADPDARAWATLEIDCPSLSRRALDPLLGVGVTQTMLPDSA